MKELADMDWVDAISRFHPLLLHLPIGLIVALVWLQVLSIFKGLRDGARGARTGLVSLLMIAAPAAAVSGWLLADGAKYPDPIDWHKWLGVGFTVLCLALGWAHFRGSKAYGPLLFLALFVLIPAAHNGGTLTHGEGFLTDPWIEDERAPKPKPDSAENVPVASAPDEVQVDSNATSPAGDASSSRPPEGAAVVPAVPLADALEVLEDLCTRCHGERKQRGGLELHTVEAMLRGGDTGPAVVFGDPEASLLLQYMRLPLDHDDHMPPANKTQPDPEEIELLERWISTTQVAPESVPNPVTPTPVPTEPGASAVEDAIDAAIEKATESAPPEDASANSQAAAPTDYFTSLSLRQIHVQSLAPNSDALWVDLSATSMNPGELAELLGPIRDRVVDLGLSRKRLDVADLTYLGGMPALAKLDLRRLDTTGLDGERYDLAPLSASSSITDLNIAGTLVTEGGTDVLANLESLTRVSLAGTGLESAVPALREQRPELVINLGLEPREPVETEPEVKFEQKTEAE